MAKEEDRDSDPVARLAESFRSLLDEALVTAIASDYDLKDPTQYEAATSVLQGLADDAAAEDATGFNPSGTLEFPEDGNASDTSISNPRSNAHNADSSSAGGSASTDAGFTMPRLTSFNGKSEEDKALQLRSMFSELKPYDVEFALKKANGDFQTALDDLLNVQYLASTGQRAKGVDGFFEQDGAANTGKGKKRKNKKKAAMSPELSDGGSSSSAPSLNKQKEEIAFLADRMDLPISEVSDIYRREWCSIGATAVVILDGYREQGIETQDDEGKARAVELAERYPGVPSHFMPTIVQLTVSIPEFSDDLASMLDKHFNKPGNLQKLDFSYKLKPLNIDEIGGSSTQSPTKTSKSHKLDSISTTGPLDYSEAIHASQKYNQARRDATESAAQLHRRGASSPLYRQAAGYYAERAREQARFASQATSAAADLLVNQQSTSRNIDLHGVRVQDGVRIARQRAQAWWDGLGEMRIRKARENSLTIVTGIGRHSVGGVSQLRQAVAAALVQDGWKVQVETGRFVITGRR
ncbi:hypothetical protein NLU13_7197 [Sarocladium strictum]|uniref:Smr domain-containing protein n=1 Tax=Sarocladium strictum TaxID=5046 RepID=A0AA39GD27_SARSR|nr:hypothetical protein NLU13_7197 [Sarocladium strictum]